VANGVMPRFEGFAVDSATNELRTIVEPIGSSNRIAAPGPQVKRIKLLAAELNAR
jgi:hypothetical protein